MNMLFHITNVFILAGAVIMALNIKQFYQIRQQLKLISPSQYGQVKPLLRLCFFLIIIFFFGYLIVFYALNGTEIVMGNFVVGFIFFGGAVFVLLVIILKKQMITLLSSKYKDIVVINEKLSANQAELTRSNLSLTQAISDHKKTELTLQRSHDTQTIVNKMLTESLSDASIMDVLELCLDQILSLPWLSFESQGCIYLVGDDPDKLNMKVNRGFNRALQEKCAVLDFGTCLCGRAASEKQIIFSDHMDERHDIVLPGMHDHGHYCIPIQVKEAILGVINIYVKPGHVRNEWEEEFLKTIANTIAMILVQQSGEKQNKEMEQRLYQSQKMESIGTMASGIAHDFNNILSGILGYAQLAEMNIENQDKVSHNLFQINKGAKRASDLIQQILTFSRQNVYKKVPVKFAAILVDALKFIRSSMPSTISIRERIDTEAVVKADQTQIHQIVMNLCTNAFHAMRDTGGTLSVTLLERTITQEHDIPGLVMEPGNYLQFEVNDTGYGIAPEILAKIFEPYFTTKGVGEGTGLGLAVVLGIVEDHNGYIRADSTLGKGSKFQVFFPVLEEKPAEDTESPEEIFLEAGSERILLVDDEETILMSTMELLEDFGYSPVPFLDPVSAFREFQDDPQAYDLIITDMTMPKMTGDEFTMKVLDIRPDIPIVLCTGYSDKITKNRALKIGIKKYLQKPIDSKKLLYLIRKILDESA